MGPQVVEGVECARVIKPPSPARLRFLTPERRSWQEWLHPASLPLGLKLPDGKPQSVLSDNYGPGPPPSLRCPLCECGDTFSSPQLPTALVGLSKGRGLGTKGHA